MFKFLFCVSSTPQMLLRSAGGRGAYLWIFFIDIMDDISEYFIGKHINFVNSIFYYNEPSPHLHPCVDYKQKKKSFNIQGGSEGNWSARARVLWLLPKRSHFSFSLRLVCILLWNLNDGDINANILITRRSLSLRHELQKASAWTAKTNRRRSQQQPKQKFFSFSW